MSIKINNVAADFNNTRASLCVKFMFYKKATEIDKIFSVKLMVKILSIFVAFLENINFKQIMEFERRIEYRIHSITSGNVSGLIFFVFDCLCLTAHNRRQFAYKGEQAAEKKFTI